MPDRAGERGHHLALRPRRPDAPHTARGRQKLGISRSYVSRIEKRALQKLEEALGERE
ncbi:MAG: sigma factor-like helix-turn-helix DNA-binding protein [Oscillibacter sp.]